VLEGRSRWRRKSRCSREYALQSVPRPAHWSGFRVKPLEIEFWRIGRSGCMSGGLRRDTLDAPWRTERLFP